MIVCKVIGKAVSTIKDKRLAGQTMLVVEQAEKDPGAVRTSFIAVDAVGAGEGELVGVIQGPPAQNAFDMEGIPVDAAAVAIFDSITVDGKEIYRK